MQVMADPSWLWDGILSSPYTPKVMAGALTAGMGFLARNDTATVWSLASFWACVAGLWAFVVLQIYV